MKQVISLKPLFSSIKGRSHATFFLMKVITAGYRIFCL